MRIIAIANEKGGVGKTTTAICLSGALAEARYRVLLVDCDSSASATTWLLGQHGDGRFAQLLEATLEQTITESLVDIISNTSVEGLTIVPASPHLAPTQKRLASEFGGERVLARQIARLPEGRYDYVILDTPPTLGYLSLNALLAAREIITPVEPTAVALDGLSNFVRTVGKIEANLGARHDSFRVLPTRVDARLRHARIMLEAIMRSMGRYVFNTSIRTSVRLQECASYGLPVHLWDSESSGAQDYRALAREVIAQQNQPTTEVQPYVVS